MTAAFLNYPENYQDVMTHTCIHPSGKCIVFPRQRRVVVIPSTALTVSSFTLNNMTNGIYLNPISNYINLTVLSTSNIDIYNTIHHNLTTITDNYLNGTPTVMVISPTQNPFVFLRNYMNIAVIELYGLYTNSFINGFFINAPLDVVTWELNYCNASLLSNDNDPYPTRLVCSTINDTSLAIIIPEGVSYVAGVTDNWVLRVHCKFQLVDFTAAEKILYVSGPVTSGTFNAYGSYSSAVNDYHFYITQASTTIAISERQVPQIGRIDLVS